MLKDNLFLISLAVLILLVIAVLALVIWVAVRRSGAKPQVEAKVARLRFDSLRNSFRQAVELIEANIVSRSERYSIPWVLVLGEGNSSEQLPIEQSGVASALSTEAAQGAAAQGISWHFFDRGIVVDVKGAYLGSPDDEEAAEKPWDEFLSLCRKYRPERPFDSVVITVPASLLLDERPDARLELAKLAKLAHRRLWLAQNRFAMRFAVYVVVSGCEEIEGFAPFARALPESMRASMLGWSSPFDLSTTYQSFWVDEAVNAVLKTVTDTSAELFATSGVHGTEQFFLLPSRIERIRSQLQLYVDELLRPSAYHEPFFFRGIYLTGDSSEAAQKAVAAHDAQLLALETTADAAQPDTADLVLQLSREPAFLRDLFENKVFQEWGLARPSRQQLTRPVLTRTARWVGIVVIGTWVIGLVVATWQLDSRYGELSKALAQIQSDAEYRARAADRSEPIPTDWYRRKALNLLAASEKLSIDSAWTVFMPGSWSFFDDLEQRAAERIEREFGEIAIATLRRELYARASDMTGVAQDTATGELIIGGECTPPGVPNSFEGARKLTLATEDLPEFSAVLTYLNSVEQLDQAIQAMQRLQRPSATEAADLRLLVKYTLGAELPGNISRSLRWFHAREGQGPSPVSLSVGPIQQATRCTITKAMAAVDNRLFLNNDLLVTEDRLTRLTNKLFAPTTVGAAYGPTVDGFREVLAVIKDQENLLGPGKGAWMRQPTPNLGQAYDRAMQRVAAARLLGPEVADQIRQRSYFAFQRFGSDYAAKLGSDATAGVVWQEKEGRFVLSSDRVALRDAISSLLNQSFMTPPRARQLPPVPSRATLAWDPQRLDQAISLGEARKRFAAEGLQKFPLAMRRSVEVFVDGQLARLVHDLAVESLTVVSRAESASAPDAGGFENARVRLAKVEGLLAELGASDQAEDIHQVVTQDALNRLRLVDDNLNRSELYAVRGRDFKWWQGERAPLLQAFGVQDAAGLQQYLGQQFARAETLDRQAETYMAFLEQADAGNSVVHRWRAIQRDLERYKLKNPNSSLVSLEQFLVTLAPDLDRLNCADKLAGKGPGMRPADYFGERYQQIYTSLASRCGELRTTEVHETWAQFAGTFNRTLAGRQPFTQSVSRDAPAADVEEIGQIIKTYDRVAPIIKQPVDPNRPMSANVAARRFAEQFERVKAFLAPLYPTEEGAAAGYDVMPEFRVNQAAEVEGNRVIDWTLEIGGQVLRWREPPRALRWEPGSPITLTLRLAKDQPASPVADPNQPALQVEGKVVVFRWSDPWSLLTMIQRQREPETSSRVEPRAQLLRLEFPLAVAAPDGRGAPLDSRSRVYMRVTLSPVGKKTPVAWPGLFPVRAPEWAGP
ncbi:MAG TPA: type VI secretion system protein [Ramlibacter sp.]|uniref:type VI secretion system protein n=1 Tax=Ramlibacter sp. TaxID=1917967 RepID=UPI002BE404CD|nr:type VI secretion system protein [Ramlibacter sp.]HVZ43843.1 type VI secretion system protein [Ramlibacter sp.]